jgi:hypothetical protein
VKTQSSKECDATDDEAVLSASEVASYTFCRQAWHLGRRHVAQSTGGAQRLADGTDAHRQIGARVNRLRTIELVRGFLVVAICGLAAVLLVQLFGGGTFAAPW